jgi:hypothetical protein
MKTLKYILLVVIGIIILPTIYFTIDRYVFNPNMKGISTVDLKNIGIFLLFPIGLIFLVMLLEKRKKSE